MLQVCIQQLIDAVCPNTGMSFGKLDDKNTWKIHYAKEATDQQIENAKKVLESFVWDDKTQTEYYKAQRDKEKANDPLCKCCYEMYKEKNPDVTFSQFLDYLEAIKV